MAYRRTSQSKANQEIVRGTYGPASELGFEPALWRCLILALAWVAWPGMDRLTLNLMGWLTLAPWNTTS